MKPGSDPDRVGRSRLWYWAAALVVVMATVGAIVGRNIGSGLERPYRATMVILVGDLRNRPSLKENDLRRAQQAASDYSVRIRSRAFLEVVRADLGTGLSWTELRQHIHVEPAPNDLPLIRVTTYGTTASQAESIGSGVADRLVRVSSVSPWKRPWNPPPVAAGRLEDLERDIREADDRVSRLEANSGSTAPERARLQYRISGAATRVIELHEEYVTVLASIGESPVQARVLQADEAIRLGAGSVLEGALGAAVGAAGALTVLLVQRLRRHRLPRAEPELRARAPFDPWVSELEHRPARAVRR